MIFLRNHGTRMACSTAFLWWAGVPPMELQTSVLAAVSSNVKTATCCRLFDSSFTSPTNKKDIHKEWRLPEYHLGVCLSKVPTLTVWKYSPIKEKFLRTHFSLFTFQMELSKSGQFVLMLKFVSILNTSLTHPCIYSILFFLLWLRHIWLHDN